VVGTSGRGGEVGKVLQKLCTYEYKRKNDTCGNSSRNEGGGDKERWINSNRTDLINHKTFVYTTTYPHPVQH
jgi:hypothetical protein